MFYRRRLPHWNPGGEVLFLTWRLHRFAPANALASPAVARLVDAALGYADIRLSLYRRLASTILPDHVHLLVVPRAPLARITHSLKSFTAHRAAACLDLVGQPIWQDESFDHWLRSDAEILATARYIVENPVRRGLALAADAWPWTWLSSELCRGRAALRNFAALPLGSAFPPPVVGSRAAAKAMGAVAGVRF
ncbi:MAG: transposase [Terriglobales bacterium]